MTGFSIPFRLGRGGMGPFSPVAMLVSATILALMISVQSSVSAILMFTVLILAGGLLSRSHWKPVLKMVMKLESFILLWILLLPFLYGKTRISVFSTPWGPLVMNLEGLQLAAVLVLRASTIVLLFTLTLSHMTMMDFLSALRAVRVPALFTGSLLIMLRYIPQFMQEQSCMRDALSLRGLDLGSRADRVRSTGFLLGSVIERAMGRSVRAYESMTLRGFGTSEFVVGSGLLRADLVLFVGLACLLVLCFASSGVLF